METINLSPANKAYIAKNSGIIDGSSVPATPKFNSGLQQDTVELSKTKPKVNKKAILGFTGALVAAGAIGAAIATGRHINSSKVNQLAEFVEFKAAQTIEEAVEFAKKNFGIENFDFGDDLELANWANEGLCKLNNGAKGKIHMPKSIRLDDTIGEAVGGDCNLLGEIRINPKDFDYDSNMEPVNQLFEQFDKGNLGNNGFLVSKESLSELYKAYKYKKANPDYNFTRMEAYNLSSLITDIGVFRTHPKEVLQVLFQDNNFLSVCKSKNIDLDIDKILKMTEEEQSKFISNTLSEAIKETFQKSGLYPRRFYSEFDTLYHEMGHLQHFKNTGVLSQIFGKFSDKQKQVEKFTKNPATQSIAGKVSWYAQTNPKEFVAEVYAKLCNGVKLSDEIMDLYKQFGGVTFN